MENTIKKLLKEDQENTSTSTGNNFDLIKEIENSFQLRLLSEVKVSEIYLHRFFCFFFRPFNRKD